MFNVGNDDLNYVCNSWHHAHHRSRYFKSAKMRKTNSNFEKFRYFKSAKMRKTNSNFEKFENTVNLLYTVWAMMEMII